MAIEHALEVSNHVRSLASVALFALMLAGTVGCGQMMTLERVPDDKVDQAQRAAATSFANKTLAAWAQDRYPKVGVPADPLFKERQDDEATQKAADKSIEGRYGNFESMTFHEVMTTQPPQFVAYRFKGKFSKSSEPLEVRVVYDTTGILGGFWIKPWSEKLE